MDRRDLLKAIPALSILPLTASVSRADVRPNDTIVIECDEPIYHEVRTHITAELKNIWPDNKVVIFGKGMRVRVMRKV